MPEEPNRHIADYGPLGPPWAVEIARRFHEAYEAQAPHFGWETQTGSRKPWDDVPENNKRLMVATILAVFSQARGPSGTIYCSKDEPVFTFANWSEWAPEPHGEQPTPPPQTAKPPNKVKDLMAALEESLAQAKALHKDGTAPE